MLELANRRATEERLRLANHGSALLEQVLEYQLLASLTTELLRRGLRFEVLRGDFDLDGHDVVIEAGGVTRHVQLKSKVAGGKARHVLVNTRLRAKPSGCVVWTTYDPVSLQITDFRWFGGAPGERLPDPGERVARHSRANADGVKGSRPYIRMLPANRFERVADVAALADTLFGPPEFCVLRQHLIDGEPASGWLAAVQAGTFSAIPTGITWEGSLELAMLIDGYALVADLGIADPIEFEAAELKAAVDTGSWAGNAAELWATLFLEHRRWRFSAPHDPDLTMHELLDTLVRQLRAALTGETR